MTRFLSVFEVMLTRTLVITLLLHGTGQGRTVFSVVPDDFPTLEQTFYPGAFRIENGTGVIRGLCVPYKGSWINSINPEFPCLSNRRSGRPPQDMIYELKDQPTPQASIVVGNLALQTEDWQALKDSNSPRADPAVKVKAEIKSAVKLQTTPSGLLWGLVSTKLPLELHSEIPGSGIFMHLGKRFAANNQPSLFSRGGGDVIVVARVGFVDFESSGKATVTLALAMDIVTQDVDGNDSLMTLVVSLFSSKGFTGDVVETDGRNSFLLTSLDGRSHIVSAADTPLLEGPPKVHTVFTVVLSYQGLSAMVRALNLQRLREHRLLLNEDPSVVRLRRIDLRNEVRFLDKGSVNFSVLIERLTVDDHRSR